MNSIQNWLTGSLVLWIVAAGGLSARVCHGQTNPQPSSSEHRLRSAVQSYLQGPPLRNFEPTPYLFAFVDLAGAGKRQAIVYLTDRGWCGSSGCTMLVLTQEGSSYRVITRIPAVKLPIRVLQAKSHGWYDLSVWIQGGGIMRGYEEAVQFDGKDYIEESSEAAEERPIHHMKGKVVLSFKDKDQPLYP